MELALESLERTRQTADDGFLAPHFGIMNGPELIDENNKALKVWKTKIERGVKEGRSTEAITKTLQEETSTLCGRPVTSMPDYVTGSISRSVLGFTRYLRFSEQHGPA